MMKRILLLLFGLMLTTQSFGSHLLGGEIWWRCIETGPHAGKYHLYLRLYRDCSGASMPSGNQTISGGPLGSISLPILTDINDPYYVVGGYPRDASPECDGGSTINCATATTPGSGAIEEAVWRTSTPVTLSGVPPASGWTFSWSSCCRPATANLSGQPGYFLRATMYPFNDGTGNRNANPCFDSSPRFLEIPKVVTCTGYEFAYNNFAFDQDLDSLYFDWDDPLVSATAPAAFVGGYTANNPLPGIQNFAQDAGQVTINTTLTGQYATCMRVDAYKFGQRVASVYRDIPIVLVACPGVTNSPPTLEVINDPAPAPQLTPVVQGQDTIYYEMTVNAGQAIHFNMQSQDYDFLPSWLPQTIKFVGVGGNLGDPMNSTTNCLFQQPCAIVTPISPQTGYSSPSTNNVQFDWQTTCDHLSYSTSAGGTRKNQYLFYFKMEDNSCPAPSFKLITARITVVSPSPEPPDLTNSCVQANTDGTLSFDYVEPAPSDTGENFDFYVIYRGGSGSSFAPYDTVTNYLTTNYTDPAPLPGANYYYVRTFGGCDQESFSSDTISVVSVRVTAFPPTNPYVAQLEWNSPKYTYEAAADTFEVWRRVAITGTWGMIGTTTDTTYSDTVNICGNNLEYQIRMAGVCDSRTDSGYFADQSNNDKLDLGYATVEGGMAKLSWPPTNSGDVLEYLVLERQAGAGWVNVANIPVGNPTVYVVPTSTADQQAETYKVVSVDSCGNQSSDLIVPAHTTMYLRGDLNPCDGIMELKWNQYEGWPGGAAEYEILADVTPAGGTQQTGVLIGTNVATDTTFIHTNLQSGAQYCYYIRAVDTTGMDTSYSSQYCINSSIVIQSKVQYMARATVQLDGSVETWTFIDGNADVLEYQVQRAEDTLGPWVNIGVVPKPTAAPYQIRFVDFSANTDDTRYFYRVRSTNECGGADTISNFGTNILLEVDVNDNLTNQLTWNRYRDYGGIVDHYNVYRKVDGAPNWVLVANDVQDTSYTDNIRQFGNGKGQFCYRVAAVEAANPLGFVDETGMPFTSFSNEACLNHDARGFFPTAFRPTSTNVENQVWKPMNLFEDQDNYLLIIQNRWGEEVFRTTNPDEGWDGTYKGTASQAGAYMFLVRYKAETGKLKEERGTFTLLR
ncbi:T9SS type B sorting domain-containing protein [Phaeocystidibacter marisrubri]|uniref:T9SS type B sorting domain-containing protein n=1 Tax=Phaeocystidibacter marisrubri TaxID=1577780 RepID=A0A6L3ZJR5_9FLAO|nr:T9SS type B sorting domain-containing protein [Phaeocystidibacter marisrubri]KAB2817879.1 T9SS type B sorting domain-containing protein [Phaeocystidibacter marisrubri]